MKTFVVGALFALLAGAAVAGNLYRWVDADGKVHYSDAPPPADATGVEQKKLGDKPAGADGDLPYSLKLAVKNHPVTLFNADCGEGCTRAAALLNRRGIPFADKNAKDPDVQEELKKYTGGPVQVPLLLVGRTVVKGFQEDSWNNTLDAAGYPRTPQAPTKPAQTKPAPGKPTPAGTKPQDEQSSQPQPTAAQR